MNTIIAIPVWEGQVSTTFDFAQKLLLVETVGEREISRKEFTLNEETIVGKARRVCDLAVQTLLCGAVSQPLANAVTQAGIQVIPFVTGDVDDVLAAYLCGQLDKPRFLQPGCQSGARRRWRHRRHGRHQQGVFCRMGIR